MFKNKVFFSFLFFYSSNIFCMQLTDSCYKSKVNYNHTHNANQLTPLQIEQKASFQKSYNALKIEARIFPQIGQIINAYQQKNINPNYLNEQTKNLSDKYKNLILEDGRMNENFYNLSAKNLVARINALEKEKYKLDNSINAFGPSMCKEIFDQTPQSEKLTVLTKLLDQRRECANLMAQSSIIEDKLRQANDILKEKNTQILQTKENQDFKQKPVEIKSLPSFKVLELIKLTNKIFNNVEATTNNKLTNKTIKKVEKYIIKNVYYIHRINKYFLDKFSKYKNVALKYLDPNGNPENRI